MKTLFSISLFRNNKSTLLALPLLFCALLGNAQLTVTGGYTATQLADYITGSGVTVFGATLTCPDVASGKFIGGSTALGMGSGIVLTTGAAVSDSAGTVGINGPASLFANTSNGAPGDSNLTSLEGSPTNDACILEFDFLTTGPGVAFDYVFGSEEYTDYACSSFNDVFGFFITGGAYTTPTNIAKVPGTSIAVCINSINCGGTGGNPTTTCNAMGAGSPFCAYYVNNASGTAITYDGLTTLLTASAVVNPLDTYHLKLGVADVTDMALDSGVFIAGSSLRSSGASALKSLKTDVGIIVYPNPANNEVTIEGAKGYNVNIYDVSQKSVLNQLTITKNKELIDISTLQTGEYFVELLEIKTGNKILKNIIKK